tara:strand:+ start:695 stop:1132 length:438 start_codon:yes stop_codon:yes gene_type:complete
MPTNRIQVKQLYEPGISGYIEEVYSTTLTGKASDVLPLDDSVYDLGSATSKWKDIYSTGVHVDNLEVSGESYYGGHLLPLESGVYDLGSPSKPFRDLHGGIVVTSPTGPQGQTSAGKSGQLAMDSSYFYVCTGENSWGRAQWAPW